MEGRAGQNQTWLAVGPPLLLKIYEAQCEAPGPTEIYCFFEDVDYRTSPGRIWYTICLVLSGARYFSF